MSLLLWHYNYSSNYPYNILDFSINKKPILFPLPPGPAQEVFFFTNYYLLTQYYFPHIKDFPVIYLTIGKKHPQASFFLFTGVEIFSSFHYGENKFWLSCNQAGQIKPSYLAAWNRTKKGTWAFARKLGGINGRSYRIRNDMGHMDGDNNFRPIRMRGHIRPENPVTHFWGLPERLRAAGRFGKF